MCAQGAASTEEAIATKTGWGGKKSFLDVSRFGQLQYNSCYDFPVTTAESLRDSWCASALWSLAGREIVGKV